MGASLPPPGGRAATSLASWLRIHCSQSGHHEPTCSSALASQPSRLPVGGPPVQYWYFFLSGGLTTPAIWPEPASTKRPSPPKNVEPRNADLAGPRWALRVARSAR